MFWGCKVTRDGEEDEFVEQVRNALDAKGWSQRKLADKAVLGEATIFRLMKGDYSVKTRRKVENILGIAAVSNSYPPAIQTASVINGGYSRELYGYYEGSYLCVRPAFATDKKFLVYQMEIYWSVEEEGLAFSDNNPGHQQKGVMMLPMGTQYVHFVTRDRGSARLITAYHMPQNSQTIRGLMLTFANPKGHAIFPAAVPIIMQRISADDTTWHGMIGLVPRDDPRVLRFEKEFTDIHLNPIVMQV